MSAGINQLILNQSNISHVKQVSQGNSSKTATVNDQVTPLPKQIQCNSSRTATANDQVIPLPMQIQCKSSKTATADDQVIPLPKQIDHPPTCLPLKKKNKPFPFIVRRGWCIKGQGCDFSHANLVSNLDLRKPVKTRKVRGPQPSSFLGNPQRNNIISYESARNEVAENRKYPNTSRTIFPPSTTATSLSSIPSSIPKPFDENPSVPSILSPPPRSHNSNKSTKPALTLIVLIQEFITKEITFAKTSQYVLQIDLKIVRIRKVEYLVF